MSTLESIIISINRQGWTVTFSASGYVYVSRGKGIGEIRYQKMLRPGSGQDLKDVLSYLQSRIDSEA